MRKACWPFALIFVLTLTTPLLAAEATFLALDRVDLTKASPPPPAPELEQQKATLPLFLPSRGAARPRKRNARWPT